MSKIGKQIQNSRVDFKKVSDSVAEAVYVFKKEFIGFKGHFIDNPVLPGICKIQAVLSVFSKLNGRHPELKEITSAKFFSPVSAGDKIHMDYRQGYESEITTVRANLKNDKKKVAQIKLKVK